MTTTIAETLNLIEKIDHAIDALEVARDYSEATDLASNGGLMSRASACLDQAFDQLAAACSLLADCEPCPDPED